jgi:DNA-binding NarL/FixJ family response regulator
MQDKISVAIADAHFLSRYGIRKLLEEQDNFEIVGEPANEKSLLQLIGSRPPHILIIDYYHPGTFNEETINKVKTIAPAVNILVISGVNDKQSIYQVLENGVHSFLTKTCGKTEITDAIRATAKGEKFFCTRIVDYLLEKSFAKEDTCEKSPLTPREIEIVQLVAQGLIAKEIADVLSLSPHTIYTHRKKIMKKLNLGSSSELVLYAVQKGYVSPPS